MLSSFVEDKRDVVKNELPNDTKLPEVIKELGRRWKSMSNEEKQVRVFHPLCKYLFNTHSQPYLTKAAEAKEAYLQAKAEYDASQA